MKKLPISISRVDFFQFFENGLRAFLIFTSFFKIFLIVFDQFLGFFTDDIFSNLKLEIQFCFSIFQNSFAHFRFIAKLNNTEVLILFFNVFLLRFHFLFCCFFTEVWFLVFYFLRSLVYFFVIFRYFLLSSEFFLSISSLKSQKCALVKFA